MIERCPLTDVSGGKFEVPGICRSFCGDNIDLATLDAPIKSTRLASPEVDAICSHTEPFVWLETLEITEQNSRQRAYELVTSCFDCKAILEEIQHVFTCPYNDESDEQALPIPGQLELGIFMNDKLL